MELAVLTGEQIATVCAIAEDHFHDRKSRRVTPAKLTKAMSAFANADGGELLVGIENDGAWDGFGKIEDCNGHLRAMEMLFPYGSEFNSTDGTH